MRAGFSETERARGRHSYRPEMSELSLANDGMLESFERGCHDGQVSGSAMANHLKAARDDVETRPGFDQSEYDRVRLKLGELE